MQAAAREVPDGEHRIKLPPKLIPVFLGKARYRGAYGGRGSGKSYSFAKMAAVAGLRRKMRILCARELQNTLRESSMSEVIKAIESEPVLEVNYIFGREYIRGKNGTEFLFRGLHHNVKEIKSISDIGLCWVEEAEAVSDDSWRKLIPTIRERGSEIWATWNPESTDSATNRRFIANPPPSSRIAQLNWRDNPWFTPELEMERQYDLAGDADMYRHVWEGEYITRSDAQVLGGKWIVESFDPEKDWDGPYFGVDWGFANDPTALVKCWIHGRTLYVEHEAGGVGIALDDTPATFALVPGAREHTIRADAARPETINHMARRGWHVIAAPKWPGSVEDGVEFLRSFSRIVIHERCVETAREARLWSWKVDRNTGDILPKLQDGNDHYMDGIRYALSPMIRERKTRLWFADASPEVPDIAGHVESLKDAPTVPKVGGLPSGVCGSCTAYKEGVCMDRGFAVNERSPGCYMYVELEFGDVQSQRVLPQS